VKERIEILIQEKRSLRSEITRLQKELIQKDREYILEMRKAVIQEAAPMPGTEEFEASISPI